MRNLGLTFLGLLLLAPPTAAFHSVPAGSSVHDLITRDAARALGVTENAVEALMEATRRPDYDENKVSLSNNGSLLIKVTPEYRPGHHCDRLPGHADGASFEATAHYVRQQRGMAITWLEANNSVEGVFALGRALHALQDCFAHSNLVDLDAGLQQALENSLLNDGPAVPSLQITGFDPNATNPMRPAHDPYPYDPFNKDSPTGSPECKLILPDGRTKFEAARAMANATSGKFLASVLGNLTRTGRDTLMAAEVQPPPAKVPVPSVTSTVAIALLFAATALRRRRPPLGLSVAEPSLDV